MLYAYSIVMSIVLAIFLGLVQGLAEFLPVSSSGHLILVQHIFEIPGNMMFFNIVLHIATLVAVLIVFRKRVWQLVRNPLSRENLKLNLCLLLATAITVGFVLLFNDFIERTFVARVLPITFMITAIVLFATSFVGNKKGEGVQGGGQVGYPSAVVVGLAQGLAVIPGFSRSGFTISAGLIAGMKREKAAEFAFLMSIPIIIAALVYEVVSHDLPSTIEWLPMSVAFVVALLSGVFAIKFMLDVIKRVKLYWFSLYLIVIAIVAIIVV